MSNHPTARNKRCLTQQHGLFLASQNLLLFLLLLLPSHSSKQEQTISHPSIHLFPLSTNFPSFTLCRRKKLKHNHPLIGLHSFSFAQKEQNSQGRPRDRNPHSPHFNRRKKTPYIDNQLPQIGNENEYTSTLVHKRTRTHTANMRNLNTPLRIIQGLLALIALGLNGYGKPHLPSPHHRPKPAHKLLTNKFRKQ